MLPNLYVKVRFGLFENFYCTFKGLCVVRYFMK